MKIFINPGETFKLNSAQKKQMENSFSFAKISYPENPDYQSDVLISYPFALTPTYLDKFPNLKLIHILSSGYDTLDLNYLKQRKIRLINATATSSEAIAEFVIGQILHYNYHLSTYTLNQKNKKWERLYSAIELAKSRVLILGTGSIGQTIAKRLSGFETINYGFRKSDTIPPHFTGVFTTLNDVKKALPSFDYVIVALALSGETKHLVNKEFLSLLKKDALLVNVARGEIVDESALYETLTTKSIRGVIVDVTATEPLPRSSPLWNLDNILITPHISFYSHRYETRLLNLLISNINKFHDFEVIETEIHL